MKRLARMLLCTALFAILAGGTALAAEKAGSLGVVTAKDSVILRAKATTESKALDKIPHDAQFVIIGSKGSFFKVEYDGEVGYVSDKYVVKLSSTTGYSTTDDLNLREKPTTKSDSLGAIDKGDAVKIYGSSGDFYLVVAGQTRCYVAKAYISTKKPSSSSDESKAEQQSSGGSTEKEIEADDSENFDPNSSEYFVEEPGSYQEEELYLAAQLIYAEGKNQSDESYQAMASVLYNRVQSSKFPDNIEDNVFKDGQFSVVRDREKFLSLEPSKRACNAVFKVFVEGKVILPRAVMFFKSASQSKSWGSREYYATIGGNMYYK